MKRAQTLERRDPVRRSARIGGHTEAEAKDLWCPHTRLERGNNKAYDELRGGIDYCGTYCRASKCMMWALARRGSWLLRLRG